MEKKPLTINIPYVIYSDKSLSATAKLILGEILNLFKVNSDNCWASNDHFAEMFGLEKANVSYHIQQIEKQGWMTCKAVKNCNLEECPLKYRGWHRHIYPKLPLSNILDSLSNKLDSPIKYIGEPIKSVGMIKRTIEKDNNKILTKVNRQDASFGNSDINKILEHLKKTMDLPALDGSIKMNRQYAWNLLRKSKTGVDGVLWLIDLAGQDPWFRHHITCMKDLWNNQIKIVASKREGVSRYVDATNI